MHIPGRRPRFAIRISSALPADELWRRLWELSRHSAHVPLTTVVGDEAPLREGSRFTARTSLGPLHVDDVMVLRRWQPPHRAVVAKTGRVLTGTIHARVLDSSTGSLLVWEQEFGARGVPDALAALLRPLVGMGYERVLRRIIDEP